MGMQERIIRDEVGAGGIEGSGLHIPIQHQIWRDKYRFMTDTCINDTWWRVANELASAEKPETRGEWAWKFHAALHDFKFIPAGRILSGAGTKRDITLLNCFVMGVVPDSMDGIFEALKESALTMQRGGGIGLDFSTIRPKGAPVLGVGADASGPLSFMDTWDAMCRTIMSAGERRGAMMATLRVDHPDIEAFIEAKRDPKRLRMFNMSVLVTDAFMQAVKDDTTWALVFGGKQYGHVAARHLWEKIIRNTYEYAEPGVIFIDRINAQNNLKYCEQIIATNPCGEQPLPPYGDCLLGSINLAALVEHPFTNKARMVGLEELTPIAVRMLDNVIDISRYPLPQQEAEAKSKRRIGLGITGLADALAMCGMHYGSEEARKRASRWMQTITEAAYEASIHLAEEKGAFPVFSKEYGLGAIGGSQLLDNDDRIRNSHLTSIAPTGTISLLAGNVSSGIEPIFDLNYTRKVLEADGTRRSETVRDYAWGKLLDQRGAANPVYLPEFATAGQLKPEDHLLMQAALQPWVDSSISKTINCPEDISFDDFKNIYTRAYDLGLKGCTTYRPNEVTGSVLSSAPAPAPKTQTVPAVPALAKRDASLSGFTYKLTWPNSPAFYVTINDDADGRPFEIFVNSKNLEARAWTDALTRMISGIFRRGGDISFVSEELKEVFDARGGHWKDGKYCPSLLAAIGGVIEEHVRRDGAAVEAAPAIPVAVNDDVRLVPRAYCPKCNSANLEAKPGCKVCRDCGYSTCG